MRRVLLIVATAAGLVGGVVAWWRRNPRTGAAWVNRVVDPWLIRQGIVANSKGELGLLEHVGRTTGVVRVTPVHPIRTAEGFRIIVPLALESHWARNVLAAGNCRLQVDDIVYELDEPRMVAPSGVEGLPKVAARVMDWLGFRYLVLRLFAAATANLEPLGAPVVAATESPVSEAIPVA